jgi:hypothetical protein
MVQSSGSSCRPQFSCLGLGRLAGPQVRDSGQKREADPATADNDREQGSQSCLSSIVGRRKLVRPWSKIALLLAGIVISGYSVANLRTHMFGFIDKKKIENQMAEWLSHPLEFGATPKLVRYRKTEKAELVTYGKVQIHVVDYEMPNGKKGRGFVNDSLTAVQLRADLFFASPYLPKRKGAMGLSSSWQEKAHFVHFRPEDEKCTDGFRADHGRVGRNGAVANCSAPSHATGVQNAHGLRPLRGDGVRSADI